MVRFKLKEALLASMKEKNKATPVRPFDLIRTELLAAFHSAFTELLIPPGNSQSELSMKITDQSEFCIKTN